MGGDDAERSYTLLVNEDTPLEEGPWAEVFEEEEAEPENFESWEDRKNQGPRGKALEMLLRQQGMWSGHLGEVKTI